MNNLPHTDMITNSLEITHIVVTTQCHGKWVAKASPDLNALRQIWNDIEFSEI